MIKILFQNSDFVAVDKPTGISVHDNVDPHNLLDVSGKQLSVSKLYPVHRLDKETSGVQVLALNEKMAKIMGADFRDKSVVKSYVGILRGEVKNKKGIWNLALTDKAEGRKSPAGMSRDRVPCETRYQVLKSSKYFSYCEFDLLTGRQHQIRKHAALANHSIVGDARYGEPKYNSKMAEIYKSERMFLHCLRLEIQGHKFESPLPADFTEILAKIPNSI